MRYVSRIRAAIFTSVGLLPLACFAERAVDVGDAARGTDDPERASSSSTEPQVQVVTPTDADDETGTPRILAACGSDSPVHAEDMGFGVNQSSPVTITGIETGIYRCESGLLHRPQAVTCPSYLPRPLPPTVGVTDAGVASADAGALPVGEVGEAPSQVGFLYPQVSTFFASCSADADCTERPLGYCAPGFEGGVPSYNIGCKYGCVSDGDCGAGYLCECGDPVGHCVKAECQSDQDCAGDLKCAAWFTPQVCSRGQFYSCQSSEDECNTSADCASGTCSGEGGRRRCVSSPLVACGRPFLIQDEAQLAGLVVGTDWSGCAGSSNCLGDVARSAIAEHWARAALMEHASIAAFARFTLQLLHLGAPRELLEASQQAMLDETDHAKACFSLAARYLATPVGPGPLHMAGVLQELDLEHIVLTAFREGCVGETIAALEAMEAAGAATDPHVQQVLTQIGSDELRHAELAWRFVRWALESAAPRVQRILSEEMALLQAEVAQPLATSAARPPAGGDTLPEQRVLSAHGVLSTACRATLRRSALLEVVLPCSRQLFEQSTRRSSSCSDEAPASARSLRRNASV